MPSKKSSLPFQLPKILLRTKGYKSKTSSKTDMYAKKFKYVTDGSSCLKEKSKNRSFVDTRGTLRKIFVLDIVREQKNEETDGRNTRNKYFERQELFNKQFKSVLLLYIVDAS